MVVWPPRLCSSCHSRLASSSREDESEPLDRPTFDALPPPLLRREKIDRTLRTMVSGPLRSKNTGPSMGSDAAIMETQTSIVPQMTNLVASAGINDKISKDNSG
jgi:hypothetical protein